VSCRFLADEDLDNRLLRVVLSRHPDLDVVRVQDIGLGAAHDRKVLEWAARQGRVLITSDRNTMTKYAVERIRQGLPLPGVIVVPKREPGGSLVDDLCVYLAAGEPGDFADQINFL